MAMVINLAEARKRAPVTPNQQTFEHGGQKYTCIFDPNGEPGKQWVWILPYVRTYKYVGTCKSLQEASVQARRQIHRLNRDYIKREEDDVNNT
jgi:hypothetical protein